MGLPTTRTARIARNTQLILAEETGLTHVADPLGGSYYVESLTHSLVEAARKLIQEVEEVGGMTKAVESGLPKLRIEEAALRRQISLDEADNTIVGVNKYRLDHEDDPSLLDIDTEAVRQEQLGHLQHLKAHRDNAACEAALNTLTAVAKSGTGNLLEATIHAAGARATLGEISMALETVFGRYEAHSQTLSGIYASSMHEEEELKEIQKAVEYFRQNHGVPPKLLLIKLGQDGHDRGMKIIATAFADCSFEVEIGPLFSMPEEAAYQAVKNDAHIIGVSSMAAGHKTLIPVLISALKDLSASHIQVVCGGILPTKDHEFLMEAGVSLIFTPGTPVLSIIREVLGRLPTIPARQ